MRHSINWTIVVFTLLLLRCSSEHTGIKSNVDSLTQFTAMRPAQVNIDFINQLTEGLNTNILMYEYFYNGAGVAVGDLNGDSLDDIYFVSNMGSNKFYLNQGGLQFRETTNISNNGGNNGPWKTGVSIADVNGDGLLDIYLCYSGAMPETKRANQLFINVGNDNNGVPHFKEQAKEYGLASTAYSNQAYFFDYDKDKDLDMLLLNHNPKSLPVLSESATAVQLKNDSPLMGTRLFKQTSKGHFEDATQSAGINCSELSYGLGLAIADYNNDNWPDFYISNDYNVPDYLYLNNRNGTFTDHLKVAIGHNSQFSMGNDAADINNDGLIDIFTLDMLPEDNHRQKLLLAPDNYGKFELNLRSGFHFQYMRNMLQLNNGDGTFSEIGQIAGVSNTDWSWAALFADYNNDGWKDLFITNGYYRDYTNLDFIKYMNDIVETKGRLKREDVIDIIKQMPSSNISNYVFSNTNGIAFANQTKNWGLNAPSNSNGAAYSDFDNDGDLDLIVNNINQLATLYRNNQEKFRGANYLKCKLYGKGKNSLGIGAVITLVSGGSKQTVVQSPARGYLSSVSPIVHFGLSHVSKVDTLQITWPDNKMQTLVNIDANQIINLREDEAINDLPERKKTIEQLFTQASLGVSASFGNQTVNDFNRQPQLPYQFSHIAPCLAKADVNKDGLEDIFIGGRDGQTSRLYLQRTNGKFERLSVPDLENEKSFIVAEAAFFDSDLDGDIDLYLANGGYHDFSPNDPRLQDKFYLNDGTGNFKLATNALPVVVGSKSCVRVNDVNGDGFADIFVGSRVVPGRYPEPPTSYLLINDGKGKFVNRIQSIAPDLEKWGMVTDACWVDMDADDKKDLIVVAEWMPISIWLNKGGTFKESASTFFDKPYSGFWNVVTATDFNRDNKPDLLVGNWGLNSQYRASDYEPLDMFHADFDNNGSVDPMLCMYIQGKSYPYLTRDELLEQQGRFRQKYNTYKSYADVTISDLLSKDEIKRARHLQVNHLETSLFLSQPNAKLKASELPPEAQFSPVFALMVNDFDGDGNDDLLLCGNIEKTKLKLGKFDANHGIVLKGDGTGRFQYVNQVFSGLEIMGDVRDLLSVNGNILVSTIQKPIFTYRNKFLKPAPREE